MGMQKNASYQVDNGVDFDEINFKTIAAQVKTAGGSDVETLLAQMTNEINKDYNGWFKDKKTGLIMQWVSFGANVVADVISYTDYTFPIIFPTVCYLTLPTILAHSGWERTSIAGSVIVNNGKGQVVITSGRTQTITIKCFLIGY